MEAISIVAGRFLLGLYFLVPGIRKFTESDKLVAYMQSHDIAFASQLLGFAGTVSIIGGIFLMTGRHIKIVSYGFVVYVLLVNFMLHDFWTIIRSALLCRRASTRSHVFKQTHTKSRPNCCSGIGKRSSRGVTRS